MRFAKLDLFSNLVTMDVFAHMRGVAAAEKGKGKGGEDEELPWPASSGGAYVEEPYVATPYIQQTPGQENVPREGGGVLAEELLIHRGIYARLGTYALSMSKQNRRRAAVKVVDGHMELQACLSVNFVELHTSMKLCISKQ